MFKDIKSNKKVVEFFKKELEYNRKAGTYLFYGLDREIVKRFAKDFAKGLNCKKYLNDFCNECESCKKIEKEIFVDLEILDDITGIKVEKIRELGIKDSVASYEGGKKIYILRDIEKLRKESSNALLKLIEEPNDGSFFILLANSLNILSTIKSRAILVKIEKENAEELEVSEEEYNFFQGNSMEIEGYKNQEKRIKDMIFSYKNIGKSLEKWKKNRDLISKIYVYGDLRDFINVTEYITKLDKIFFAEEIFNSNLERADINELIKYYIEIKGKELGSLEKFLNLKENFRTPINVRNFLITFFCE